MRKLCLVFFLFASVYAESQVRQTETWMPPRPQVAVAPKDLVSSGDSPNGSDFEFPEEDHDLPDNEDDENEWDYSGSGDEGSIFPDNGKLEPPEVDVNDNTIPEQEKPVRLKPTISEMDIVQKNEVGQRAGQPQQELESNVLMSHAGNESYFGRTEVLAALIAGSTVGLLFAVLLILLLVYRMKKKDEGSYDLGKKPIYKKAATTEIYA